MNGDQVRDSFIRFFESKGHLHMPSASLIPAGDPTLLFTSAGMVPFKPFFTGEQTPPARRLTSSQKSFRTTDIDEVGDHKHLTFFEMLGNFSIGDYFKEGAVAYAWELLTEVFKLAPDRMFVTIHLDDDEAFEIWRDQVGVPVERIYRYGDSDNWWGPAGNEGATGPCSELHYDGGRDKGCRDLVTPDVLTEILRADRSAGAKGGFPEVPGCHPNCDCERFVELWNLVFMQYYQDTQGERTPLPAPSIDTGMGLERTATVLQNKANIYETDIFSPIIEMICQLTGNTYSANDETDYAIRVVAEHSRAASFLISDGVIPGSDGRGYVLRRIIRRAMFYMLRLIQLSPILPQDFSRDVSNIEDFFVKLKNYDRQRKLRMQDYQEGKSFLLPVIHSVIERMGGVYGDLPIQRDFITETVRREEELFYRTLTSGEQLLREILAYRESATRLVEITIAPKDQFHSFVENMHPSRVVDEITLPILKSYIDNDEVPPRILAGFEIFLLSDTYGFPLELTREIAREQGYELDMEGFDREMEAQREKSRATQAFTGDMEMVTAYESLGVGRTQFVGYDGLQEETMVRAIVVGDPGQLSAVRRVGQGQRVELLLRNTPFYPEGGGQLGDRGTITGPNGVVIVEDTQSPVAGLIVHKGVVQQGDVSLGEAVSAQVDPARRLDASRNHSGTHLLHASLRAVLGPHVRQAGSMVAPERLRFDFSHVSPLSADEVGSIQSLANERIRDNLIVSAQETTYSEAVWEGALAFFGDRYGDVVRVVSMSNGDPFSVEVCGGTHVSASGQVGTLFVLGESSIGGGMRRIEAVTGQAAEGLFVEYAAKLNALSQKLQTPVHDLETRLDSFLRDSEELKRRLAVLERTALRSEAEELLGRVADVNGIKVVTGRTSASSPEAMREMGDFLKAKLSSVVVVLSAVINDSPLLVAMVTPDLVDRGVHAGNVARDTAKVMGGGGGGRPEMAQAGGRQVEKLDEALRGVPELVRRSLS